MYQAEIVSKLFLFSVNESSGGVGFNVFNILVDLLLQIGQGLSLFIINKTNINFNYIKH